MGIIVFVVLALIAVGVFVSQSSFKKNDSRYTEQWTDFDGTCRTTATHRVLQTLPHDPTAFTQGLQQQTTADNTLLLLESTGMYNESLVRLWNILKREIFDGKLPWHPSTLEKV